jgi:hypothetical protein
MRATFFQRGVLTSRRTRASKILSCRCPAPLRRQDGLSLLPTPRLRHAILDERADQGPQRDLQREPDQDQFEIM